MPRRTTPNPPTETQEAITRLAHKYWQERQKTHQPGSALEDWLQAESDYVQAREAAIDEASEESFPASDPPAW
ncbi:MAG TPA: DUF2934 domain-containing protein [Bryobacteraceae bacterium]|jgi:hypothetical protein